MPIQTDRPAITITTHADGRCRCHETTTGFRSCWYADEAELSVRASAKFPGFTLAGRDRDDSPTFPNNPDEWPVVGGPNVFIRPARVPMAA